LKLDGLIGFVVEVHNGQLLIKRTLQKRDSIIVLASRRASFVSVSQVEITERAATIPHVLIEGTVIASRQLTRFRIHEDPAFAVRRNPNEDHLLGLAIERVLLLAVVELESVAPPHPKRINNWRSAVQSLKWA
jgi:hypothetical protein